MADDWKARMIRVRRVYDAPREDEGVRILVDRLWPRGVKKDDARLTEWAREAAPSSALRKWIHQDATRWPEFVKRYHAELDEYPEVWASLLEHARRGDVTLLYAARNTERNNAVALRGYLEARLADS